MKNNPQKFRVILLTHGGADAVLRRLSEIETAHIAAVFVERKPAPQRSRREKLRRSLKYDGFRATAAKLIKKSAPEKSTADATEKTARELGVPIHFVADFHSADSIELIRAAQADLGVIYGTNIIKESVFAVPRLGSINLHQGLAPFYRGSAPIFWELFNDEQEVGITVHRVAAKVDAGDIVLQEVVRLAYDFARYDLEFERFIADFRDSIKEKCAALVAESVRRIAGETAIFKPQDISVGRRYKLPTKREKDELRRRLRERRKSLAAEPRKREENREKAAKQIVSVLFVYLCVGASLW